MTLACVAGEGRSMHKLMLSLFIAGVIPPERYAAGDLGAEVHEAGIWRAFQRRMSRDTRGNSSISLRQSAEWVEPAVSSATCPPLTRAPPVYGFGIQSILMLQAISAGPGVSCLVLADDAGQGGSHGGLAA